MNEVAYGVVEEKHLLNDEGRITYGIAAYHLPQENGSASIALYISDISDNYDRISALVNSCNVLKLSLLHLVDVVEDFLSE